MRLLRTFSSAVLFGVASSQAAIWSCAAGPAPGPQDKIPAVSSPTSAHSISLPHFEPELPVAPGRDEFMAVCVSCHSPRYVTMQPAFPQRQWETTVDKMVKSYGAQMDQTQRLSIVGYLVTINGPETQSQTTPPEDEDVATPIKLPLPSETAPGLELASDAAKHLAEVKRGADLFKQDCIACHGPSGRGDGFVGQVLLRKPKDLAATRFSLQLLARILWNGKRGTAMPSWRALPQPDLVALAAYVQSLHQPSGPSHLSAEDFHHGDKLFQQNCAPCHGTSGNGKGPVAANLMPEPANFKLKQPDPDYISQVLAEGIPGTAMPTWQNQIAESDRRVLAEFIRTLFEDGDSSTSEGRTPRGPN
jgi:mono/diheme cytochrome c family protein